MSRLAPSSLRILLLFVVSTGLPLAALTVLGAQFLRQDADLELQRQREDLHNASEWLVRELHGRFQAVEDALREPGRDIRGLVGRGAFFRLSGSRVVERHGVALPFYPTTPPTAGVNLDVFAAAERLEFQQNRCDLAVPMYRRLAAVPQVEVRGEALMRLARCARKLARLNDALAAYRQLGQLGEAPVAGLPSELVARRESIAVLEAAGRAAAARDEEGELRHLFVAGRWALDRGTFEFVAEGLHVAPSSLVQQPFALAAERWSSRWRSEPCGRSTDTIAPVALVGAWCQSGADSVGVLVLPVTDVLDWLRPAAESRQVAVAIGDGDASARWGAVAAHGISVSRALGDLSLPWQLSVSSARQTDAAASDRRRALALSGLALMVVVVVAAAGFVLVAVSRELQVARAQADFIGTVSHEFRTPLTAMAHLTEMLQEAAVPAARVPDYYAALHRETTRLQRVVEGLLDFNRFESGGQAYTMRSMDVQDAVRQVIDSYASRDGGARLAVSLLDDEAIVCGDRDAVAVAVSSLIDNALKYSPADATVSVAVERRQRLVGISVADCGPGISEEERRRIFGKFVRGAAARGGTIKGTGVGLAIVSAVTKAHRGRLELRSTPGEGSRFTLLLPQASPPP